MLHNETILIAGAKGLVGSAIHRCLLREGYTDLLTPVHAELDLMDRKAVSEYFKQHQPKYVVMAAAKVGGILANDTYPADFIFNNLEIQNTLIQESWAHQVDKLIFLGSSCIYPKHCPQPMQEEHLLSGRLEPTNEPYAIAKIAGIEMCWAYNRQHGTRFLPVMPTNLYGPGDNFDLETSHVLPALLRKFHLGVCLEQGNWNAVRADLKARPIKGLDGSVSEERLLQGLSAQGIVLQEHSHGNKKVSSLRRDQTPPFSVSLEVWGSGEPRREFLHVDDLAEACVFLLNLNDNEIAYEKRPLINIGTGRDISIRSLAELMQEITGFQGELVFNTSKPDGTPQKLLNVSMLQRLGWESRIGFKSGIRQTYDWYRGMQDGLKE